MTKNDFLAGLEETKKLLAFDECEGANEILERLVRAPGKGRKVAESLSLASKRAAAGNSSRAWDAVEVAIDLLKEER